MFEISKQNKELKVLEEKLEGLSKPFFDEKRKAFLRNKIMAQVKLLPEEKELLSFQSLLNWIKVLKERVNLSSVEKSLIKEKIIAATDEHSQKKFFWFNLFAFHKKFVSVALLLFIFMGMFVFVKQEENVVMAKSLTILASYEGEVFIRRDGQKMTVYPELEIREDDKIVTGSDSIAVIQYFDDSVSRLSENSELVISKLYRPNEDNVESHVEVVLLEGKLWSKVISLVDGKSSFSVEAQDLFMMAKKAAFNVEVDSENKKMEVEVFNRSVDVFNLKKGEKYVSIVTGQKAVIDSKVVEVKKLDDEEKNQKWVAQNLKSDKDYILAKENEISVNKTVEEESSFISDAFYFPASLRDKTVMLLTFDDVKKKEIELNLAEKELTEAKSKLAGANVKEEERVKAQKSLENFSEKVKEFYQVADEVGVKDKNYSDNLKEYVEDKVLTQKKELSVVAPDSPLYEVKKTVDDLDLLKAEDEEELQILKQDNVSDKLSEIEDINVKKDGDISEEVVQNYKENLDDVVEIVDSLIDKGDVEKGQQITEQVKSYTEILSDIDDSQKEEIEDLKEKVEESVPVVQEPIIIDKESGKKVNLQTQGLRSIPVEQVETRYGGVKVYKDRPLPPGL